MAVTMTIAGTAVKPASLRWNYTARNRGTAAVTIKFKSKDTLHAPPDPPTATRPQVDDEVIISSGATRVFAGRIVDTSETSLTSLEANSPGTLISLSVSDYNIYATRITVHQVLYASGAFTRKQILQDLVNNYLNPKFGTTLGTVTNGSTFGDLRFDNVTIEDVLNHLTTLSNEVWFIDENNVLQCETVGTTSTGLVLTDIHVQWSQIQRQRTQYANIVNVIAGPEDMHEVVELFSGAGTSFQLKPYKYVSNRGYIIETTAGTDVYYPLGRYTIDATTWTIDLTTTPPTLHRTSLMGGGATATFTYTAKFPFTVQAQIASEVTARGPWETTVRAENVINYDAALAFATTLATNMSVNARTLVKINLRGPTVLVPRPGRTLSLTLTTRNLTIATYVIVAIEYDFDHDRAFTMRHTLDLTTGSSLPRVWEDFFGGAAGGASSVGGGVLTGTVLTNGSGMFDTDVVARSGSTDSISLLQNAAGSAALISNSSCLGPAVVIGSPANTWSWAIIANYLHLASGIAGGAGRRALCFFYVAGGNFSGSGAMSLTQDSAGTASTYYLTPENPAVTLGIGSPASGVGVGFRVDVYANVLDVASSAVLGGSLNVVGDFSVNTSKFTVQASTGNTVVAGTLGVTSDFKVNTNKFVVTASSGNTTCAGTFDVTGNFGVNAQFSVNATQGNISSNGNLAIAGSIFEHNRGTALGDWITPSFNAGDYTGGGGWTVASGDVTTAAYTLDGKSMTYATVLVTTTVTGGNNVLSIAIPGGFTAAKQMATTCEIIDNGTRTTGRMSVNASGTTINIQRTDAANFAASTDNTAVRGELRFEVT